MFDLNIALENHIIYSAIEDNENVLKFIETDYQNWQRTFQWGQYHLSLLIFRLIFIKNESKEKKNEILQNILEIAEGRFELNGNQFTIPPNFDKSKPREFIYSRINNIIKSLLSNNEQNYFRKDISNQLIKLFEGISPSPKAVLTDFIKLQTGLISWLKKHNLTKDWLLSYAVFFLSEINDNPNIKIEEIEIPVLHSRSLTAISFEFEFEGWSPSDEGKEDYEERITKKFNTELQKYFLHYNDRFNLDELKRVTKPLDYKIIKSLVRKTVQNWNFEKIVELDYEIIDSILTKKKFTTKIKYLKDEMPKLKQFNLPYFD